MHDPGGEQPASTRAVQLRQFSRELLVRLFQSLKVLLGRKLSLAAFDAPGPARRAR